MKPVATAILVAVLALPLLVSEPAHADQTAASTISQIKVLTAGDARHKLFHGAVWLQVDKATQNYRWGGRHCNGITLSDSSLALLFAAFQAKHSVTIDYDVRQYKQQTSRCITAFTVTR